MNFLLSVNEKNVKYARVIMQSVYANNQSDACVFYVMHGALDEAVLNDIADFASQNKRSVHFIRAEGKVCGIADGRYDESFYYPLIAHLLLPEEVTRILYLGSSVCVNGGLKEFYDTAFDDAVLVASQINYDAAREKENPLSEFTRIEKFDSAKAAKGGYFNSDVLLLNIAKLRAEGVDADYYKKVIEGISDILHSQGIFNLAFAQRAKLLTTCLYNYRLTYSAKGYFSRENYHKNSAVKYEFCKVNPVIINFVGQLMRFNPWDFCFERGEIGDADKNFLNLIPEMADLLNIWWGYARSLPDFAQMWQRQLYNKSAYYVFKLLTVENKLDFSNKMGLGILTVPSERPENSIISGDDLNDFVLPRIYRCADGDKKMGVKNLPVAFLEKCGFRLTVKNIAANSGLTTSVIQILEPNLRDAVVFRRNFSGGKWGEWKAVSGGTGNVLSSAMANGRAKSAFDLFGEERARVGRRGLFSFFKRERHYFDIMLILDDNYVAISFPFLKSLIINNKWAGHICFHVVIDGMSRNMQAKLRNFLAENGASVCFYGVNSSQFAGLKQNARYPAILYSKLIPHLILPSKLKKVLYLDVDMAVNSSLQQLYETELGSYCLGACLDVNPFIRMTQGITGAKPILLKYVNSGTVLYNLEALRRDGITLATYKKWLDTNTQTLYEEQLLNNTLLDKIYHFMPYDYNYHIGSRVVYKEWCEKYNIKPKEAIIHYFPFKNDSPIIKPWDAYEYFYCKRPNDIFDEKTYSLYKIWWDYFYKLSPQAQNEVLNRIKELNHIQSF